MQAELADRLIRPRRTQHNSHPLPQYEYLERTAERKRVSIAWVIRDAVEKLVAGEAPLFQADNR